MKTRKKKNIKRYFLLLKGVKLPWLLILCSVAFSVIMMSAELQVATMTASIIDTSQTAIDTNELFNYIAVAALSAVCTIFSQYFTRKMEETITLRVRVKLWLKIMHLPMKYYDEDNGDGLITRVTSDASAPADLFSMVVSFVVCIVTTVQGFVQMFAYNTTLALYSLLIIPLTFVICLIYGKLTFKLGVYSAVTVSGSMGYLAERVRSFRLIKRRKQKKAIKISKKCTRPISSAGCLWRAISLPPVCSPFCLLLSCSSSAVSSFRADRSRSAT